ncbi:barren [Cenococcum geophilum 1.58]|uniref:barren n=1 Tax=Cenococcum geophilum 1.58 TaxID=794803 RepID=UPI00359012BA|nr:barren [Cenococcum geophilum 1.58]
MPRARDRYAAATPHKTPMKIPLNDDRQEKANRLHSRQALHEAQLNSIKAAATPVRRRISAVGGSPGTPTYNQNGVENGMPYVGGNAVTPMKRVPILANFEEWMKMATDNKINATNSWNFALIDYFHDMSLLKEGDGVNFQRASCTLDGCVKIYTSRVDSVATETGKLLSGLADSGNKKRRGEGSEGGDGGEVEDEDEEGEDGIKKRKKRSQRSSEATLATSFAQLQLKKMELEFSVDPLFKKASADFDEGGAKGLLLNHLTIDGKGRIVFDSSDDVQDIPAEDRRESARLEIKTQEADVISPTEDIDIDITTLASKYFPDLSRLEEQDICPSLKAFDLGDANGSLDLPFLKTPEDWRQESKDVDEGDHSGVVLDDENAMGFDDEDDDDGGLGGFNLPLETGFGEGGEAWAKEAALEPQMRLHTVTMGNTDGEGDEGIGEVGAFEAGSAQYGISLIHGQGDDQENILNYFDQAIQKNWAGPEHWRIRRIKDITRTATSLTKRKEKEPFEIDFTTPLTQFLADALYTPASSNSTITMPKAQWKSKTRNLLPDDKHFNSRQLLRLFLKPEARMGSTKAGHGVQSTGARQEEAPEGEVDEAYWARKENRVSTSPTDEETPQGNYDADFFQDDGLGLPSGMEEEDDDFADAREHFSPPAERGYVGATATEDVLGSSQEGAFGAQLVTQSRRLRPEYVQYARVAKKVDVRRLKEELWRGIGFENLQEQTPLKISAVPVPKAPDGSLKFTDVMNNLQSVYPKQTMADISTSYCFICLLHLANEKGLVINNEENFQDLTIRRDFTADLSTGGD